MNIDFIPQIFLAHHRAFDMPAGPPVAPGRFPVGLPILLRFPEHKVQGILLLIRPRHKQRTVSSLQIIQILMGKLSILLKIACPEINGSVLRLIGIAFFYQSLNHIQHSVDFIGSQWMSSSRPYIHCRHIFLAFLNIPLGNHRSVHPFFHGLLDNLVVYIGKIGHIIHIVSLMFHIPPHRVKHNHRAGIPDMNQVINRRPADIHPDFPFLNGYKFLFLFR